MFLLSLTLCSVRFVSKNFFSELEIILFRTFILTCFKTILGISLLHMNIDPKINVTFLRLLFSRLLSYHSEDVKIKCFSK